MKISLNCQFLTNSINYLRDKLVRNKSSKKLPRNKMQIFQRKSIMKKNINKETVF